MRNLIALLAALVLFAPVARADELLPLPEFVAPVPALQGFWTQYGWEWEKPTKTDVALIVAAELLIAADAAQTVYACNTRSLCEVGLGMLFVGNHPSTEQIIALSASAAVITGVLWYVFPSPWRKALAIGVDVGEGINVIANAHALGFVF